MCLWVSTTGAVTTPQTHNQTCPNSTPGSPPIVYNYDNMAVLSGDLNWGPISATATFPLAFFQRVGTSFSFSMGRVVGTKKFQQRLILYSRP
ncbi:MAG: hypothetical protein ACHQFZ_03895 [Acidimicrobiales bacterium]